MYRRFYLPAGRDYSSFDSLVNARQRPSTRKSSYLTTSLWLSFKMTTYSPPMTPPHSHPGGSERPRAITSMSYASNHSHKSSRSREEKKLDLIESPRDKRRLEGKADPTKALSEAQPGRTISRPACGLYTDSLQPLLPSKTRILTTSEACNTVMLKEM